MSPGESADFLKNRAPAETPVGRDLLFPEGTSAQQLIASLEEVFGEDDTLAVVAVHGMQPASLFVTRFDFLDAVKPELKGVDDFGASDHLNMPGTADFRPMKFICPIDDQVFTVFFLEPAEVRTCPNHPGTKLRLQTDP